MFRAVLRAQAGMRRPAAPVLGSWVSSSSPLGTGEERKAHTHEGNQEKSPQEGLGTGPPPWAGPGRGCRSPHCGISRLPFLPRGLAHLDRGGRLALAAAASSAQAARCSALTPSTWPGRSGWASKEVLLSGPFYQLNQMRAPPTPPHSDHSQVALELTRGPGSQAVAWLLPKPENACFQRPKPSKRLNSLFCPRPPGHLSRLCGSFT